MKINEGCPSSNLMETGSSRAAGQKTSNMNAGRNRDCLSAGDLVPIQPYYDEDGITIYHGDCREVLPSLGTIDLVLTDPPYGINLENHRGRDWTIEGDSEDWSPFLAQFIRCMAFASPRRTWAGKWDQWLVWDKGPAVGGGGDPQRYWKQSFELIQVRGVGILSGPRDEAVLRFHIGPMLGAIHPAAKPVTLIQYLIQKVSSKTILDPFMGSGTTLLAAKNLGRRAIGIEVNEQYCRIAVQRLRQMTFGFGVPATGKAEQTAFKLSE